METKSEFIESPKCSVHFTFEGVRCDGLGMTVQTHPMASRAQRATMPPTSGASEHAVRQFGESIPHPVCKQARMTQVDVCFRQYKYSEFETSALPPLTAEFL
jgi:hypothetical protein